MRYGFIREKEEIKFLVLYVMGYLPFSVSFDAIYDICSWCDDGFSYFDLKECFDELLTTQHIIEVKELASKVTHPTFFITEKGKKTSELFEDHLPYTVKKEAEIYTLKVVRKIKRNSEIRTSVTHRSDNDYIVHLDMNDVFSINMNVVNQSQASILEHNFKQNAEKIYNEVLNSLIKDYSTQKNSDS